MTTGTTKWADFAVTAVHYNFWRLHIETLKVQPDNGDSLGDQVVQTRVEIVRLIEQGHRFVTAYFRDGKWQRGEDIRVIKVNGTKYLRTDNNSSDNDNLGGLPEF